MSTVNKQIAVYGTKAKKKLAYDKAMDRELPPEQAVGLNGAEVVVEKERLAEAEANKTFGGQFAKQPTDWSNSGRVMEWLEAEVLLWGAKGIPDWADKVDKHLADRYRAAFHRQADGKVSDKAIVAHVVSLATDPVQLAAFAGLDRTDQARVVQGELVWLSGGDKNEYVEFDAERDA